jgi:hypothetical protein
VSDSRRLAPLQRLDRASRLGLAFWAVLVVVFVAALIRAVVRDDGERSFFAAFFFLNACFWLVRSWWSRRDVNGQARSPSPALAPPRLWMAGGILLSAGSAALLAGFAWLGFALLGVAVSFVLPLAMEDRRRRR